MRSIAFISAFVVILLSGNNSIARTEQAVKSRQALLLVLPIFGDCPPELKLPWAGLLAESLSLILPEGRLKVVAQQPTEPIYPGALEPIARQKGDEIGANAVVWGELLPSSSCNASRVIRLRILDLESQELHDRKICPEKVSAEDLARVLALFVANALRDGVVDSISITKSKKIKIKPKVTSKIRRHSCPPKEPCVCPPCKQKPPKREVSRFSLIAGGLFSSHPNWDNPGFGLTLGIEWKAVDWFSVGLSVSGIRGRRVEVDDVNALFTSWPVSVYCKFYWNFGTVILGLDMGGALDWSRLDVLIERLDSVKTVEKINPVLFAQAVAGLRIGELVSLMIELGPAVYLRKQKYTYTTLQGSEAVLSMQTMPLTAALILVVDFY